MPLRSHRFWTAFVGREGAFKMTTLSIYNASGRCFEVLIDDEDYDKISKFKWVITSPNKLKFYACTRINKKSIFMHRYLLKTTKLIDHIDQNGLNNQKQNLREATFAQNRMNATLTRTRTSSKYKGVHFSKRTQTWQATIKFNQKTYGLGWFENEDEAALAYNLKAQEFFKDFAFLNIIPEGVRLQKIGKHLAALVHPGIVTKDAKYFNQTNTLK
jgi:hypothetical protein